MNNCLVAIGSWSFLVAPTFQMRSCMGRSDLDRGPSGVRKKTDKMLCKLFISSSKENNRLTLTSKWKLVLI